MCCTIPASRAAGAAQRFANCTVSKNAFRDILCRNSASSGCGMRIPSCISLAHKNPRSARIMRTSWHSADINPAPNACPFTAHTVGTGNVMMRPIKAINSLPNACRSPASGWALGSCTQSRSRPLEKNFSLVDAVTNAAGPEEASTSSNAAANARTKVVFQRFSPAFMVRVNTSPSRSNWIISPLIITPMLVVCLCLLGRLLGFSLQHNSLSLVT